METEKNIKDFWESIHEINERGHLTGSSLNEVWGYLNIQNKLVPNIKILNIGIGTGAETIELSKHNVIIDVLDISEIAINKVKDITRNQYLSSNIENLPINEYDIAVSHLVSQHIDDDELNKQIKYVLRSLNTTGTFAMQFAFNDDNDNKTHDLDSQKHGNICRSLSEMDSIIKKMEEI